MGKKISRVCPVCNEPAMSRGKYTVCKNPIEPHWVKKSKDGLDVTDAKETYHLQVKGQNAVLSAIVHEPIHNDEDLVRVCKVDTQIWMVDRWELTKTSPYRKDKEVNWSSVDGQGTGTVKDSGKLLVLQAINVKVYLVRRTEEIRTKNAYTELLDEVKQKAPKLPKIKRYKFSHGLLLEVDIPDLHLGKLTWSEETDDDYNIEIAREFALRAVHRLLDRTSHYNIDKILLPWGNDFFNVDTIQNTTTKGTPQQEDTRWNKTFKYGRQLTQDIVNLLRLVAPVEMKILAGNHDKQRMFMLGEVINAYFHNAKDVTVDNSARTQKYFRHEKVMIGLAHGSDEKPDKLPMVMAMDMRKDWAKIEFAEWHLGDKHHKIKLELVHEEVIGCVIRYISSLSSTDVWHFEKLFKGNIRSAAAFVYDPQDGFIGEFQALGRE